MQIVQAANDVVVKSFCSQTVNIDNKTPIKYNTDNSTLVAVYFNSSRDGSRIAYMHVAKDANGQYAASLLYQGPASEANDTKPSQGRHTWILRGSQEFYTDLKTMPQLPLELFNDNARQRYQGWYGNGQIQQLYKDKIAQGNNVVITGIQDNVTVEVILQDASTTGGQPAPVGPQYKKNIVWTRDPNIGAWQIDSFDRLG